MESPEDRALWVTHLKLCPRRLVLYVGERYVLAPLPLGSRNEPVQGVPISWQADNPELVDLSSYNEVAGLKPGRTQITARAGRAAAAMSIEVRDGARPTFTDAEWRNARDTYIDDCPADSVGTVADNATKANLLSYHTRLKQSLAVSEQERAPFLRATDYVGHMAAEPAASTQSSCDDTVSYFGGANLYNQARGAESPRFALRQSTPEGVSGSVISYGSSNYTFEAPVLSLGGRGIGVDLTLTYNSRVWSKNGTTMIFDYDQDWPAVGWSLGYGFIVPNYNNTRTGSGSGSGSGNSPGDYLLVLGDGSRIHLDTYLSGGNWKHKSDDGTFIEYAKSTGLLSYPDGHKALYNTINNRLLPVALGTPNGDKITITYKTGLLWKRHIDYITDTLGRVIHFNYDANKQLTSITAPAFGSGTRTLVQLDYQTYTFAHSFDSSLDIECPGGLTRQALRRIYYPVTGTGFLFSDYSEFGMIRRISQRVGMGSLSSQTGTEVAYTLYDYPVAAVSNYTDMPSFTMRSEWWQGKTDDSGNPTSSPSNYTYARTINTGGGTDTTTVTYPNGLSVVTTSSLTSGDVSTTEYKNSSGTVLRKEVSAYVTPSDGGTQLSYVERYNDANESSKVAFDYGSYGRVNNKYEYNFKVGGTYPLVRRTQYSYLNTTSYINKTLLRLVTEVSVYDGSGAQKTKQVVTYDDYAAKGGMQDYGSWPPNHDSAAGTGYITRGNITGTQEWSDIVGNVSHSRLSQLDIFGNVVEADVDCCSVKSFVFSTATWYSQRDSATDGIAGVVPFLTTSYSIDFNTGLRSQETSPENLATQYSYDSALRVATITLATGATQTATHDDTALAQSSRTTYMDSGVSKTLTSTTWMDGRGNTVRAGKGAGASPTAYDVVATKYDAMGRLIKQSNPYVGDASGAGSTSYWTTTSYDLLNRPTQTTLPDSEVISIAYSGAAATRTDIVNRQYQQRTDGLGRVVEVKEQNPSTGSLDLATTFLHDVFDNATEINQGGQLRTFTFDALSRLVSRTFPESGTESFTYTSFGAIRKKTEARGVEKHHSYDELHRLTSIWFTGTGGNDSGSVRPALPPGVAATADVTTSYVSLTSSGVGNGKVSSIDNGVGVESFQYDSAGRVSSRSWVIDGRTYTTQYTYNSNDQVSTITYPSSRQFTLSKDSRGRLSGVSDSSASYISSIGYNTAGLQTSAALGNSLQESWVFSADRHQLSRQTVVLPGSPTVTLMDLTYGYTPVASGAFGINTSAKNCGQLVSVTGTVNGQMDSRGFAYDNLERLTTAKQDGVWERRYVYDRWANRTEVWNAESGGSQIQAVSLAQSGGIPSNRVTSIVNNAVQTSYAYDSAGNVTSSESALTYDAENRVVSAVGVSSGTYKYNSRNQRVWKDTGGTTTYYVWEGDQVIAEYSGSGVVAVENVFASGRLVARRSSGGVSYQHADWLSTRLVTDSAGAVVGAQGHMPFGESATSTGSNDKRRFTTYDRDSEASSDYAINRQYDYSSGRFFQVDPVCTLSRPQLYNKYAYVGNDPINRIDPLGLYTTCTTSLVFYPGNDDDFTASPRTQGWYIETKCITSPGPHQSPGGGGGDGGGGPFSDYNSCYTNVLRLSLAGARIQLDNSASLAREIWLFDLEICYELYRRTVRRPVKYRACVDRANTEKGNRDRRADKKYEERVAQLPEETKAACCSLFPNAKPCRTSG